ncbi:MAG: diguanylate cyclase [Trueperaceae bacterium]|nr:diguanylate cyclase [Trueperaceae bacterium]
MQQQIRKYWSNLGLALKGIVVTGFPIFLFVVAGLVTTLVLSQLRGAENGVNMAYQTQLKLQEVQNLLLDASTGVRGFLLTDREDLLAFYQEARDQLPEELNSLEKSLSRYPDQLERFNNARTQIEQELSALATLLQLAPSLREAAPGSIDSFVITSQVVMQALEQQLNTLVSQQQSMLKELESNRQILLTRYYVAIVLSTLAALISLLLGMRLFASGITRRVHKLSLGAESLARGQSFNFGEKGHDELGRLASTLQQTGRLLQERENEVRLASDAVRQKFEELTERHHQIVLLNQLGVGLQHAPTIDATYGVIETRIIGLCPHVSGMIYLYDDMLNAFVLKHSWGTQVSQQDIIYAEQCRALNLGRHYAYFADPYYYCGHLADLPQKMSLCLTLAVSGKKLGLLVITGDNALAEDQRQILGSMADRIALAFENLQLRDSLLQQAIRDPLTSLYNRRYLDETLHRELERAKRADDPLSIIVADIDHFKSINDRYGHDAGDEVLKALGAVLSSHFRMQDIACRYGGEEFIIVLPETELDDAIKRAESLRQQVKSIKVELAHGVLEMLTLSMGVASFPVHGDRPQLLIKHADVAMYRAKSEGRDRVEQAAL